MQCRACDKPLDMRRNRSGYCRDHTHLGEAQKARKNENRRGQQKQYGFDRGEDISEAEISRIITMAERRIRWERSHEEIV